MHRLFSRYILSSYNRMRSRATLPLLSMVLLINRHDIVTNPSLSLRGRRNGCLVKDLLVRQLDQLGGIGGADQRSYKTVEDECAVTRRQHETSASFLCTQAKNNYTSRAKPVI
jgi:hypothetical protein